MGVHLPIAGSIGYRKWGARNFFEIIAVSPSVKVRCIYSAGFFYNLAVAFWGKKEIL
jgi:hypothetical protein